MPPTLTREITISPGYDLRNKGPEKYGIVGCNITFYIHGPKGSIQCQIMTDWYPSTARNSPPTKSQQNKPWITDIVYHSKTPMYEGQTTISNCFILGENACYYDGTSLNSPWEEGLVNAGSKWLWEKLEQLYLHQFEDGKYPDLTYESVPYPKEN